MSIQSYKDWIKESNPGNYVSVSVTGLPLDSVSKLDGTVTPSEHITIMYSKDSAVNLTQINQVLDKHPISGEFATVTGVHVFDSLSKDNESVGCIVLTVESDLIKNINLELTTIGCKHSYTPFEMHATLIYDAPLHECLEFKDKYETKFSGMKLPLIAYENTYVKKDWATS